MSRVNDRSKDSHLVSLVDAEIKNKFKWEWLETVVTNKGKQGALSQFIRELDHAVKCFHVDERVAPGFRYTVRYVGDEGCLFDGEARRLESIGLGYGRRLTFKSDRLNFNDCFFWSDSRPEGFAFNIEAVKEGDVFTIMDADHQQLGTVEIQQVEFPQVERETLMEDKAVVKTVSVRFACSVKLFHAHHSLVNIDAPEIEVVEGLAEVVKERGSKEARVRCIKDVFFQSLGSCSLHEE